ncbi:MAG: hypothetical protein N2578_05290 [Bdellovibrionaceae bacterium]|nr:hypothetical protein [Pseudobdellovibrionaceae bacterium]
MEKISRILPPNARTRSIDVSASQPVRPGAVAWGRPVGKVTTAADVEDRVSLSKSALERLDSEVYNRRGERPHAKIVEEMSNRFFNRVSSDDFTEDQTQPSKISAAISDDQVEN